jgi:hypothetical protein
VNLHHGGLGLIDMIQRVDKQVVGIFYMLSRNLRNDLWVRQKTLGSDELYAKCN